MAVRKKTKDDTRRRSGNVNMDKLLREQEKLIRQFYRLDKKEKRRKR